MECEVCGAAIEDGYKYCKSCGTRLAGVGISKDALSSFLKERLEVVKNAGTKQAYQQLIDQLNRNEFQRVEIQKSSVQDMDMFKDMFEEFKDGIDLKEILDTIQEGKDGVLKIVSENSELFVKLTMATIIDEFDTIHNEISQIQSSLHDDRKSKIYTAFQQYQRAVQSKDPEDRSDGLRRAADSCLQGINELRLELNRLTEFFSELPRSTVMKLFCGVKLRDAKENLHQVQEAFHFYCSGVRLLMQVDLEKLETERLISTLQEERAFLKKMQKSHGYERLLEVDDVNATKWEKTLRELAADIYCVENYIGTENIHLKILEES